MKFGGRMRAAGAAAFVIALGTLSMTPAAAQATFRATAPGMVIEFDAKMQSRLLVQNNGKETPLESFEPAESLVVNGKTLIRAVPMRTAPIGCCRSARDSGRKTSWG